MNNDTIPWLLWDKLLCNCCCQEKDGVWDKGTIEEKLWWHPNSNCLECKPYVRWLQYLNEHQEDIF